MVWLPTLLPLGVNDPFPVFSTSWASDEKTPPAYAPVPINVTVFGVTSELQNGAPV